MEENKKVNGKEVNQEEFNKIKEDIEKDKSKSLVETSKNEYKTRLLEIY